MYDTLSEYVQWWWVNIWWSIDSSWLIGWLNAIGEWKHTYTHTKSLDVRCRISIHCSTYRHIQFEFYYIKILQLNIFLKRGVLCDDDSFYFPTPFSYRWSKQCAIQFQFYSICRFSWNCFGFSRTLFFFLAQF